MALLFWPSVNRHDPSGVCNYEGEAWGHRGDGRLSINQAFQTL